MLRQPRHSHAKVAFSGRPLRVASMAAATSLVLLCAGAAGAQQIDNALLARIADHQETLRLERDLADIIAGSDRAALQRFGEAVKRDGGGALLDFAERVQNDDTDAYAAAKTLGPCHMAGLSIRLTAMAIAEGKVEVVKRGNAFITEPSDIGEELGSAIGRCEVVRRLPVSERRIGTNCLRTGQDCQ